MNNNRRILTSVWFLIGVILLLLNDFYFKEVYANWITGKLSDFSGLFVFSIFWLAFFPNLKKVIICIIAILFILWKSTYSQGLIHLWNSLNLFEIQRIVDFSDLIALSILPVSYYMVSKNERSFNLNIHPVFPITLAAFAFCATSNPRSSFEFNETYTYSISKTELIRKINALNVADTITNNEPLSIEIQNANDFFGVNSLAPNPDTTWYYVSTYDTIYDTLFIYKEVFKLNKNSLWRNVKTNQVDTIYQYIYPTKDTLYINKSGVFYNQISIKKRNPRTKKSYFISETAKIKVEGDSNSSSLTLLEFRDAEYSNDERKEKEELKRNFETHFIEKIKLIP